VVERSPRQGEDLARIMPKLCEIRHQASQQVSELGAMRIGHTASR
jgi:hypothetical protein